MKRVWTMLALAVLVVTTFAGGAVTARAATAITYGPERLTGIPAIGTVMVHQIDAISLAMQVGQTAYVYSEMWASSAEQITLVDNEVNCSGAGVSNVVMGENIDQAGSPNTDRVRISIVTQFLVSATTTGTLTCRLYYRGHSLSPTGSALTLEGEFRFEDPSVGEDASGAAMQRSLPYGNIPVTDRVYTPILDATLTSSQTQVDVIAGMEFMSCDPGSCAHSSTRSDARFTLFVNQMNGDTVCRSATPAQLPVSVTRQTHHKAVLLHAKLSLAPGCRRLYAYVRTEYVAGPAGSIQGAAVNLPDADGSGSHTSAMTHLFALPR
ncbi:hypothetical protein [Microlunatus sp. GCM10028923]|uniref:hypothetical protein n=1 Tax=Microlunatus sp. GCM10028923 TaxID=3273400 RepID=UPI00362234CF